MVLHNLEGIKNNGLAIIMAKEHKYIFIVGLCTILEINQVNGFHAIKLIVKEKLQKVRKMQKLML